MQSVHISLGQSKAKKSIPGKARLDKILNLLFDKKKETSIVLHTLASCLDKIEHFLKKFQAHKPMAYTAHSEIFCVLKLFAECFILNDHIPTLKANELAKLKYTERSIQKRDGQLFVGTAAQEKLLCLQRSGQPHLQEWAKKF